MSAKQLRHDVRIKHGAAGGNALDRLLKFGERGDPVLEQVADPAASTRKNPSRA